MVDWKGFSKVATSLAQAFSVRELKVCLLTLDRSILANYTLLTRILVRTGIASTTFGRDLCFGKLFSKLVQKNPNLFKEAPPFAVTSFNTLVKALFSQKLAQKLLVTTEVYGETTATLREKLVFERRSELFLKHAGHFSDLQAACALLAKSSHNGNSQTDWSVLCGLENKLDERMNRIEALNAKKEALFKTISHLPKEKPSYFKNEAQNEKWKELFDALLPFYSLSNNLEEPFESDEAFTKWCENEERLIQQVAHPINILSNVKSLQVPIQDFQMQLHDLLACVFEHHVAAYFDVIEEALLAAKSTEEITTHIKQQTRYAREVHQLIKDGFESLKKRSVPSLQKLFSPENIAFKDLPKEVDRILTEPFKLPNTPPIVITEEVVKRYKNEINAFNDSHMQIVEQLVSVAKVRSAKLDEMEQFQVAFLKVINQVRFYKDLKDEFAKYETEAKSFAISRQELGKASFQEIEKILQERFGRFEQFRNETPKITRLLSSIAKQSEQRCIDNKLAIKRRLFEIFWNISPYQDLSETFAALRTSLTDELKKIVGKFYEGELTSSEFLFACQEMPYEHDVVKVRNELTHRSARLKDLRDEAIRLYREVLALRRLLEIAGGQQERVLALLTSHQLAIRAILGDVENPFKSFAKAVDKDAINYVFRNLWIRIEELQPVIDQTKEMAIQALKKSARELKSAFLKTLISLEEHFLVKDGLRLNLVLQAERDLALVQPDDLFDAILAQTHAIEKRFSFCNPFSFFMLLGDHGLCVRFFQEAALLDERLLSAHQFAKNMQYVKTFEEERVDMILEAFERQYLIEDEKRDQKHLQETWQKYQVRMQKASSRVEDEVFLDIGLIDRQALMDVDPQDLNKALELAIERAKSHLADKVFGVFASLRTLYANNEQFPLCKMVVEDLQAAFEGWLKVHHAQDVSTDELLEHLRTFCHCLFDAKVLLAASKGVLLPLYLKFMNELRSLSGHLEGWIQEVRKEKNKVWGIPWIPECYSIRNQIGTFEPLDESTAPYRVLVKKIYEQIMMIPEIVQLKESDQDPIKVMTMKGELSRHLDEIEALSANPKREHPFIYIPGYLAFFEN